MKLIPSALSIRSCCHYHRFVNISLEGNQNIDIPAEHEIYIKMVRQGCQSCFGEYFKLFHALTLSSLRPPTNAEYEYAPEYVAALKH